MSELTDSIIPEIAPSDDAIEEDSLDDALNTLESAQKRLDSEIQDDLLGIRPVFLGMELRPIRLSSLALLQKTGNQIVSGKPVAECDDLLMDACKLVLLQSIPLREAVILSKDLKEFEFRAYELMETVPPDASQGFIDAILSLVSGTQNGRVEPIPEHVRKEELTVESMGES